MVKWLYSSYFYKSKFQPCSGPSVNILVENFGILIPAGSLWIPTKNSKQISSPFEKHMKWLRYNNHAYQRLSSFFVMLIYILWYTKYKIHISINSILTRYCGHYCGRCQPFNRIITNESIRPFFNFTASPDIAHNVPGASLEILLFLAIQRNSLKKISQNSKTQMVNPKPDLVKVTHGSHARMHACMQPYIWPSWALAQTCVHTYCNTVVSTHVISKYNNIITIVHFWTSCFFIVSKARRRFSST